MKWPKIKIKYRIYHPKITQLVRGRVRFGRSEIWRHKIERIWTPSIEALKRWNCSEVDDSHEIEIKSESKMFQTKSNLDHHEPLVLKSAIYSRILLITLIIFFRILASPYDTSASLNPPCLTATTTTTPNETHRSPIASSIENGIIWDSVYFIRAAECGYEYEQSYAFLPLLPLFISFFSPHRSLLALSSYLINNLAFVLAALYFYRYYSLLLHFFFYFIIFH